MYNYLIKSVTKSVNKSVTKSITPKFFSTFKYTKTHEYIKINKDTNIAQIGLSKFAADNIGDIVLIEMPKINDAINENEPFAIIDTSKSTNDIHMPILGKIIEINDELNEDLKDELNEEMNMDIIINSPLDEGWLVKIKYDTDDLILSGLMDEKEYESYIKNLK